MLGIRRIEESGPRSFGTLAHIGLEAWWLAWLAVQRADGLGDGLALPLDAALEAMRGHAADVDGLVDAFDLVKAEELLRGYDIAWGPLVRDELTVLAVEAQFDMPLVNPDTGAPSRTFRLAGKIDLIVRTRSGETLIAEHKTTSEDITPGSRYWQRLRMDGQVSMYYDGASALGFSVDGCLYDVLARPHHKPKKATPPQLRRYTKGKGCKSCGGKSGVAGGGCLACQGSGWTDAPRLDSRQRDRDETPDEYRERVRAHIRDNPDRYFGHGRVVRLDHEIEEFRFDLWRTAVEMRETEKLGHALRNPAACVTVFGECDYFDVCTGVASLDDPERFYSSEPHPELDLDEPAQLEMLD